MVFLLRALPGLIDLGLLIYCLIDCIQTPDGAVRNLPKWVWIVVIIVLPFLGPILWLTLGRPERAPSGFVSGYPGDPRRRAAPAPDDDPDFLREIGKVHSEHEQTLEKWEQDLKRREEELRRREDDPPAR